jgi:hypothetical protein
MKAVIPFVAAILLTSTAQAQNRRTIPAAFQGDWSVTAALCAPGPADNGNVRIGRVVIMSFETRMDVRRVRVIAAESVEVSVRAQHGSATYNQTNRLTLLDGGSRLAIGDGGDRDILVRCGS